MHKNPKSNIQKNILVLSGGTGTAWSICNALRKVAGNEIRIIICDINPYWLVHTSSIADEFIQVLPITSNKYYASIIELLEKHNIDIIVPLLDFDLQLFARDNDDLRSRNVFSTAPIKNTFEVLSNKRNLFHTLKKLNVMSPQIFDIENIESDKEYFIKPVIGFGSRNARKIFGHEINKSILEDYIIQELCGPEEITVDISCIGNSVKCICRERVEVKAGVCTKAKIYTDKNIENSINKISDYLLLPECCCAQFMKGSSGEWMLTDFNLRLGAGSALSAATGFIAAEAAASAWLKKPVPYVEIPNVEHYVVRYYSELVTK